MPDTSKDLEQLPTLRRLKIIEVSRDGDERLQTEVCFTESYNRPQYACDKEGRIVFARTTDGEVSIYLNQPASKKKWWQRK